MNGSLRMQLSASRSLLRCTAAALLGMSSLSASLQVKAQELGGHIEAVVDGKAVAFPSLKTDIKANISGDLASITVTQRFANPLNRPVDATYLFPLNKDAAVNEMTMAVGDERIQAVIQRKAEARQTYNQAKAAGKGAALLEQHRPNMFTQSVANLMPGLPITVNITYVQTVPKVDGQYELVVPLVVGPRYIPSQSDLPTVTASAVSDIHAPVQPSGQWVTEPLPAYPPVNGLDLPSVIDEQRVSIEVDLNGAMPVGHVSSHTHALDVDALGEGRAMIRLATDRVIDNKDFVLRYRLDAESAQAGLLTHRDERGGFFSLLIEPPATAADNAVTNREMVFVLDTSGSMSGKPMAASKAFMREVLQRLRPDDHFRIIRFSDKATEFSSFPLPATANNISRGIRYTDGLRGGGGTVMTSGIQQALGARVVPGAMRIVVFLTDGYIGNEAEVLGLVHRELGDARLFALGVGNAVNRYLLSELGREGRGFTRYMTPDEEAETVAVELADRLQSPVLTDIEVDWGGMQVSEAYPSVIPDLFAGHSVRVQGRFEGTGRQTVTIKGRSRGNAARMSLAVDLPGESEGPDTLASIWARSAVAEAMEDMHRKPNIREAIIARITDIGLSFRLATRWTSFVAVSEKIYNQNPEGTASLPVPLPMVDGVTAAAYPSAQGSGQKASNLQPLIVAAAPKVQSPSSHAAFAGGSTPEPGPMLGLATLAGLLGVFAARNRRRARHLADKVLPQTSVMR